MVAHEIGQSVMLDNGAFSAWKAGKSIADWAGYYDLCEEYFCYRTTWAVIPDVIDGTLDDNIKLITAWPLGKLQGAPVWHLHEPVAHLLWMLDKGWYRICFGSSGRYADVGSAEWRRRMDHVWNKITDAGGECKVWIHMLRGMALAGDAYPFSSVDSTNVAQNHKGDSRRGPNNAVDIVSMARNLDAVQCPARWGKRMEQQQLIADIQESERGQ